MSVDRDDVEGSTEARDGERSAGTGNADLPSSADRECVHESPPATGAVLRAIRENERVSQGELVEETGLSRNAVRSAVDRLDECGAISVSRDVSDPRYRVYELRN